LFATPPVTYGHASAYVAVPAGHYAVDLVGSTGKTLVAGKHWPVAAGTVASLVVVHSTSGSTLEVVTDAAGVRQTPTGAMATGFGGAAAMLAPSGHPVIALVVAVAAGILVGGLGMLWFGSRRSKRAKWVGAAGASALVAIAFAAPAVADGSSRSAAKPVVVARAATPAPVVARAPVGTNRVVDLASAHVAAISAVPSRVRIPALGIDTALVRLGLNGDGTAQVPSTATQVGWFSGGVVPGQPGPAVILGHVDSKAGPGVFFRLHELQPGAEIDVSVGKSVHTFAVQRVQMVAKNQFPTAAVFGPIPDRGLRLVTCGGPFDRSIGHYEDNVIVYATQVRATTL
jgi:sortase (surface protein transpeptidase)